MAKRLKMEPKNAPLAFKVACDVYERKMKNVDGRRWLAEHGGFNVNTAGDLIADFRYLMQGKSFERTMGNYYASYFLENIFKVFGRESLSTALVSFEAHIEYYEQKSNTKRHGLRAILAGYQAVLESAGEDVVEQGVVEFEISHDDMTKTQLLDKIHSLENSSEVFVSISGLRLKRKNWIIVLIKRLRDHKCQLCDTQIRTRSGGFYVEAAHINSKAKGGAETIDNILLLCPNHHKEFDLGELEIVSQTESQLVLILNGTKYEVQRDAILLQ